MGDATPGRWALLAFAAPLVLWVAIFWPDLCVLATFTFILSQDEWRYTR
jgi:hypothetical protein